MTVRDICNKFIPSFLATLPLFLSASASQAEDLEDLQNMERVAMPSRIRVTNRGKITVKNSLPIVSIAIEGNKLVTSDRIFGIIKTRVGDEFDRELIVDDLLAIKASGLFTDDLRAVPELNNSKSGISLKFCVQEIEHIKDVGIGNSVDKYISVNSSSAKVISSRNISRPVFTVGWSASRYIPVERGHLGGFDGMRDYRNYPPYQLQHFSP